MIAGSNPVAPTIEIKDGRRVPLSWREYLTARLAALEGEVNHIQAARASGLDPVEVLRYE